MVWALMRVSGIGAVSTLAAGLVNVIRGIPIIVLLFYLYFVMPDLGITLTALQASILGLGIAYSAYQSENFRAGIEAIDKGQIEAAQAIEPSTNTASAARNTFLAPNRSAIQELTGMKIASDTR